MSCVQGRPWSVEEKRRLQGLIGTKRDRKQIAAAFPGRTHAAVLVALKRCASKPNPNAPSRKVDRAFVRIALRNVPLDLMADRLPDLIKRTAAFNRPKRSLSASEGSA